MTLLNLTVWYVGYAFFLIGLLVIIGAVAAILHLARMIGDQGREIAIVLNACRRHTDAMPTVESINWATNDITWALAQVRERLTSGSGGTE